MTSLGATIVLQLSILATGADPCACETYADAHRVTNETGKPMLVMVGADWCPACVNMKENVMPQVRRGLLRRVAYAIVNMDRDREVATQLVNGGPIPQLVMYHRVGGHWRSERLIGGQDVGTIENFIQEGVAQTDTKKAETAKKTAPAAQPAEKAQTKASTASSPLASHSILKSVQDE
jgi:thioredoxin-like negative regulator of GroEL